ncbi:MAG TPA: 3-hydroxy-3-methylglutaryl CoA synthase [Dehalococcoidia bacterium]|nr:3-hydroxy-3-methylglutaryl CoA synthase [Dehalococcoidia bacterium]
MVGITSYGAYVPLYRLDRSEFFRAWGGIFGMSIPGEKAVANFDEDTITMSVEAAIDCLSGIDPKTVDGLFSATTTSPYKDRQCSGVMSMVLDLRRDVRTMDVANSLRAGTSALTSAIDAIEAGTAKSILVTAADMILAAPAGDFEQAYGDGSAAVLLGNEDVIASVEGSYSVSDEFAGMWRTSDDTFVRAWEDRMILDKGYSSIILEAINGLMKKYGLSTKDFTKMVCDSPLDVRRHSRLARELGFDESQVQDPMFLTVGNTGCALAMMMLVAALEESKPGDRILFASYGNGADAFVLEVTPEIEKVGHRRGMKNHLASKKPLKNYESYLRWRRLVTVERARRPELGPTTIAGLWRDRRLILGLWGKKCTACGTPQIIQGASMGMGTPTRICVNCQAKDQFEEYRFADKKAKVFTFTQDNLADTVDPPAVVTTVDFEGGGRAIFDMTDRDPNEVSVDMPVEMTFRKLFYDAPRGIHNYFWKTRPVRC